LKNLFLEFPEFIDTDPRTIRTHAGYKVTSNFQYLKHCIAVPPELVSGKSVIDLGCCVGATGAWVLSNGASRYVGVELQEDLAKASHANLTKRFIQDNWIIYQESFNDFFSHNTEKFDVVILFGVMYHGLNLETFIKNVTALQPEYILLESIEPKRITKLIKTGLAKNTEIQDDFINLPMIELTTNQTMISELVGHTLVFTSAVPNKPATQVLFCAENYKLVDDLTSKLTTLFPDDYTSRYSLRFQKTSTQIVLPDFETTYTTPEIKIPTKFSNPLPKGTWVFDQTVAESFEEHARQHIPNYDRIINQTVQVCNKLFKDPNSRIIDVGSATGETIRQLFKSGFHNLVGVESSISMLDKVKNLPIAHWIHSDKFPIEDGPYSAVCCNWTLHFIKDKIAYLTDIYAGLVNGGVLILTDKTYNTGIELELYHDFKLSQGVSEDNIKSKADSVKDIMFIDSPEWYLTTLKDIGFKVSIINADYCFTTFLAIK